VLKETELAAKK